MNRFNSDKSWLDRLWIPVSTAFWLLVAAGYFALLVYLMVIIEG